MNPNKHTHPDTPRGPTPALFTAEHTPLSTIDTSTPVADQATWGELERALASSDSEQLEGAYAAFAQTLDDTEPVFVSRKQAEAAAVLACSDLYRGRLTAQSVSNEEKTDAANRIKQIREVLSESAFDTVESYDFELHILEELLAHGYLSFISSPREEGGKDGRHNNDVYILREKSGTKIPISAKLGAKKGSRYNYGVRSASKREWLRKEVPLIDYLRECIPEIR